MKKLMFSSAVAAAFYAQAAHAAVALEPQSVDLEPFSFVPTLVAELRQDSNIYSASSDEVSSLVAVIAPTFRLIAEDRDNSYVAQYGLIAGMYGESNNNYFDNIFNVNAHIEPTGRFRFDLGAGYSMLHDNLGTGRTEGAAFSAAALSKLDPDQYTLAGLNGALEYGAQDAAGQIAFNLGYNQKRYDLAAAADIRDLDSLNGVLEFRLRIMPKTKLLLDIERGEGNYSNAATASTSDYTDTRYLLGMSWENSASTTGKLRIGEEKHELASGKSRSSFTWDAGVVWTPLERDTVTFNGSQRYMDGTFPTISINSRTVALGWSHDWTTRWQSNATASFTKDDHTVAAGNPARQDDTTNVGLALNYQMRRWFILGAGASFYDRSSTLTSFEYKRQIISLNAQLSL